MCSLSSFRLRIPLPDVVSMQTRQPNLEGKGAILLRRLVKEALRMRPSRIIVGEVRLEEALDLLIALNSGLAAMREITCPARPTLSLTRLWACPGTPRNRQEPSSVCRHVRRRWFAAVSTLLIAGCGGAEPLSSDSELDCAFPSFEITTFTVYHQCRA